MKWRYQNLRIVLHRPVLLNIANRSGSANAIVNGERRIIYSPSPEELAAVENCRRIAKETIEDIYRDWSPNQMAGWNAVWFLYQASMIPLVSIFWESWNTVQVGEWQKQIETVLSLFGAMAEWSLAARRSLEVVSKMYEASKRSVGSGAGNRSAQIVERSPGGTITKREGDDSHRPQMNGNIPGSALDHPMGEIEGLRDVMISEMQEGMELMDHDSVWDLDGMLWGDGLDMPFDGMPQQFFGEMDSPEQMAGNGMVGMNNGVVGSGGSGNTYDGSGGNYMMR